MQIRWMQCSRPSEWIEPIAIFNANIVPGALCVVATWPPAHPDSKGDQGALHWICLFLVFYFKRLMYRAHLGELFYGLGAYYQGRIFLSRTGASSLTKGSSQSAIRYPHDMLSWNSAVPSKTPFVMACSRADK